MLASPPAELLALLLADARLPVAGHTQSAGLEPAVRDGIDAASVPAYLATRLATVVRVEAGTAVVALHHLLQGVSPYPAQDAWAARTPSPAMRTTSQGLGRALLRVVGQLWPDHPALERVRDVPRPCRAVVLAGAAACGGLSPASLVRVIGYDDVQTVAAAALKLLPLDPVAATRWVHQALPAVEALAEELATLTEPGAVPASSAPQIEAWAQVHAYAHRRLFSA